MTLTGSEKKWTASRQEAGADRKQTKSRGRQEANRKQTGSRGRQEADRKQTGSRQGAGADSKHTGSRGRQEAHRKQTGSRGRQEELLSPPAFRLPEGPQQQRLRQLAKPKCSLQHPGPSIHQPVWKGGFEAKTVTYLAQSISLATL